MDVLSLPPDTLALLVLKSAALPALILALTALARRASAAQRHLVLALAGVALVLLPVTALVGPAWETAWLPRPFATTPLVAIPAPPPASAPRASAPGGIPAPPAVITGAPRTIGPQTADDGHAWPTVAGWLWLAGAGAVLLWILGGKMVVARTVRTSVTLSGSDIETDARAIAGRLGLNVPFHVRQSDKIRVPVVTGWLRPILILPERIHDWPADRRAAVLTHELAHIRRGDTLTQFLAQLACAIHWFNPLVWLLERRLLIERERACDDAVLRHHCKASDYAQFLMDASAELGDRYRPAWALAGMAEGTDFKDRVLSILDPNARRGPVPTHRAGVIVGVGLLVLLPFLTLQPWASPDRTAEGMSTPPTPLPGAAADQESAAPAGNTEPADPAMRREHPAPPDLPRPPAAYWLDVIARADAPGREEVATALGEIGGEEVLPALLALLADENARVRRHAAEALKRAGLAASVQPLCRTLEDDPEPRVREHAAEALGRLGDRRAVEPLCRVLRADDDARVREHAAEALGHLGDERALPALVEAMNDPHPRVSRHAAEAVTAIRHAGRGTR